MIQVNVCGFLINLLVLRSRYKLGNIEDSRRLVNIKLDKTSSTGSVEIDGGADTTISDSVTLTLTATDATSGVSQVRFSNDDVWDTEPWGAHSPTKAWVLNSDEGIKSVYYQINVNRLRI
jgi:hypothetical protein